MKRGEQRKHRPLPPDDTYLPVREAAAILGMSSASVYRYLRCGKLPGERIGQTIVLRREVIERAAGPVLARPRSRTPIWRVPVVANLAYLLHIRVRLRSGQEDLLKPRLVQIRAGRKHLIPGTVARYITRNCAQPGEIQVVLIWRSAGMPAEAEREAALQELRAELDDLLDWSTATSTEGPITLNT